MPTSTCPNGAKCDPTTCGCCQGATGSSGGALITPCPGMSFGTNTGQCANNPCPNCTTDADCPAYLGQTCDTTTNTCTKASSGGGGSGGGSGGSGGGGSGGGSTPASGTCPNGAACDPTTCGCCTGAVGSNGQSLVTPCSGTIFGTGKGQCAPNTCPNCATDADCATNLGQSCNTTTNICEYAGTGGTTGPNPKLCPCTSGNKNECLAGSCQGGKCIPSLGFQGSSAHPVTIRNATSETLYIGITPNPGYEAPNDGGWPMKAGTHTTIQLERTWGGRIWARTGCSFDKNGNGTCLTGDCNGKLKCDCISGTPPATLVEMTFDGGSGGNVDYYDVSMVDGFNIPVRIEPVKSTVAKVANVPESLNCTGAGCIPKSSVASWCPAELQVKDSKGNVVACSSPCHVFDTDQYCCRSTYDCSPNSACTCATTNSTTQCCETFSCNGTPGCGKQPGSTPCDPNTQWPVNYAAIFKSVCPSAYSYQFDDCSSTHQCSSAGPGTPSAYVVTFGTGKASGAGGEGGSGSKGSTSGDDNGGNGSNSNTKKTLYILLFSVLGIVLVAGVIYLIMRRYKK